MNGNIKILLPLAVFVPFWGAVCAVYVCFAEKGIRCTFPSGNLRMEDGAYGSSLREREDEAGEMIPLEEALVLNRPCVRRSLMLDVISGHPGEYMELLEQARLNRDAEVAHYAATAMAELYREADLRLRRLERQYAEKPEDPRSLEEYCEFLGSYLKQGMAKGQMKPVYRNRYCELLIKRLETEMTLPVLSELAETLSDMGKDREAFSVVERILKESPRWEEGWMLKLKYYALHQKGEEIRRLLWEMQEKGIYLSSGNQERVKFWQQGREKA